jgi:hypothetical protein
MSAEQIAQAFQEAYDRLAPDFGFKAEFSEQNTALLVAVVQALLDADVITTWATADVVTSDEAKIRDAMTEAMDHPGRIVTR